MSRMKLRKCAKAAACPLLLLLFLSLCACGSWESRAEGVWQGDGSLSLGVLEEHGAPFEGAQRWAFDGKESAVATVDGREVPCHYYMTDDTLTLNAGGEVSWGMQYELKGDTLRIGNAVYTKVK